MALLTAAKANLKRLALVRMIVIGGETAALLYAHQTLHAELRYSWLLAAIALQVAATAFIFWRLRKSWPVTDGEFFGQLLIDVGSLGLLLYCSGGATNPFVSYYLVPLAIAGAVLPSRYTASLAATCIGAYTALLFFYEPLPLLSPLAGAHQHMGHAEQVINPHVVGMWFNFTLSAVLITYVVARMANALRDQYAELNQRREQALHNEQLLAVATLAAGTAHELGTPLTTMKILLDEMAGDDPALRADIELLKQQVHTCHATLKNLVATAESHQRRQFPLQAIDTFLREVLERWQIVRPNARYRLAMPAGKPGAAPPLRPDETLQQALINLLNNGADACDEPLELALHWDERDIVLRIRDHGAGVPLEIAEQLGKPFVTSKGKGLGLGLFLSHATIERCGGDIRMYNHAEGGTEVVLRLPIADAPDA